MSRTLDALVAERIFNARLADTGDAIADGCDGEPPYQWEHAGIAGHVRVEVPHYSTSWADAGCVVTKMGRDGWSCRSEWKGAERVYANTAEVAFGKGVLQQSHAVGDSMPEAICLAALRAVGVTQEEIEAACKEAK